MPQLGPAGLVFRCAVAILSWTSAPLTNLLVAAALLGSAEGCSKSSPSSLPKDVTQEAPDAGGSNVAVDVSAAADASMAADASATTSLASCSSDDDCATWSSYCREAPCVCRVYARTENEPRCSSAGSVACFVDPCMKKTAACQDGRCVLVMQPTR